MDHLRWDLKQIFEMAVAEGFAPRKPGAACCSRRGSVLPATRIMTIEEVRKAISRCLNSRAADRTACDPGRDEAGRDLRAHVGSVLEPEYADIRQRVYRGDIDSPKSMHSVRWAALSNGLLSAIREWRQLSPRSEPGAWVFPSETGTTPVLKDNCWRRHFAPKLKAVGSELGELPRDAEDP